ncbi:hypothetical protein A9K58_06585 [Stenotrophomonas maltophilia]|uniref:Uncharacterized protein n=1 Tax=Stenotrophomonas maltophilia TaxID=40324 RepID=A0A1A6Y0V5_STEMA|nr:hypothetical protein [Stenotrophomonas maltophilia]OBU68474.1 hypothetical protein A9K58_06585 [Stenotrophomonas maltophilia]
MFSTDEIDRMMQELDQRLPVWATMLDETAFMALLDEALCYIALGADPRARAHCLRRTGKLHLRSGQAEWCRRFLC